jgi:hypothetical protein
MVNRPRKSKGPTQRKLHYILLYSQIGDRDIIY